MVQNNELLTPELLIRYGFKPEYSNSPNGWYSLQMSEEYIDLKFWFFRAKFNDEHIHISTNGTSGIPLENVKYLYQLKNLYETITGKQFTEI